MIIDPQAEAELLLRALDHITYRADELADAIDVRPDTRLELAESRKRAALAATHIRVGVRELAR